MLRSALTALILSSGLAFALPSKAAVIFGDNFDSNVIGNNVVPSGWFIANSGTGGAVDIKSSVSWGKYVDLDGSFFKPGQLSKTLSLPGGIENTLTFELEGNTLFAETVDVTFGTSASTFNILADQSITSYSISFTPSVTGDYTLSFLNGGADNWGASLITVTVTQAPGPVPILGVAAVFGFSRKLRKRIKSSANRVSSSSTN